MKPNDLLNPINPISPLNPLNQNNNDSNQKSSPPKEEVITYSEQALSPSMSEASFNCHVLGICCLIGAVLLLIFFVSKKFPIQSIDEEKDNKLKI